MTHAGKYNITWYRATTRTAPAPGTMLFTCNQTDRPSVVRGLGASDLCLTPEPSNKQLAVIGSTPEREYGEGFTTRPVSVSRVAATLTQGRLPDGRHAAQLAITSRQVYLDVRTIDEPEITAILGSARLVDVDHLGCPTHRPPAERPPAPLHRGGMEGLGTAQSLS